MNLWKRASLLAVAAAMAVSFAACGAKDDLDEKEEDDATTKVEAEAENAHTTEMTEPEKEIRYEKQTVYLCVGYTTTQTENGRSRGYVYDYDEYGRVIYESLSFDGVIDHYRIYYYDDAAQTAYYELYDEEGKLKTTSGTRITGPEVKIEGTPEENHGTYVCNEDGYIVEEWSSGGTVVYRREYDENYTEMTEIGYPDDETKRFLSREATLDEEGRFVTEVVYTEEGAVSVTKTYTYDELGRVVRIDNDIPGGYMPLNYPWIYEYDDHGNLIFFDADYYYGYETVFQYEPFEIFVPVTEE